MRPKSGRGTPRRGHEIKSSQPIRCVLIVNRMTWVDLSPFVFEHPRVHSWVLAFHCQRRFGCHSVQNEVVVTVRAVFIALLEFGDVFPEGFLALFADERHLRRFRQPVGLGFCVAFGTIEPKLAAGRADGNLGVQDVLAHVFGARST